ncbi:MAG: methylmalonyl Co-A mutase-associated GTPase MeaB [Bacteroidales bacterium]|jgi:LAO/AO transport system kinase|nr:methylmalonyl Co-A mutase-associated GTPase MeaB [Bacteroidales bacterium]
MEDNTEFESALHVQEGINMPSQVNPYLDFSTLKRKPLLDKQAYIDGILSGDRVALSQAITLIESSKQEHYQLAQSILDACIPYSGNSIRIGITGVPGAGKSTFIESFGKYLTGLGHKLAVLAIDPSSERSKGSILGDKTRMEELAADEHAFIRPSPSAGSLGGVARKTAETLILCEAAGFGVVFIETVGVGQSETTVHSMVDFFILLIISGAGDELQGIKRGIMEMADAVIVNKADGDNIQKAERTRIQYANVLTLFSSPPQSTWKPPVMTISSLYKTGIVETWEMILRYKEQTMQNGFFMHNRTKQLHDRFRSFLEESLFDSFYAAPEVKESIARYQQEITDKRITPYAAGKIILEQFYSCHSGDKQADK